MKRNDGEIKKNIGKKERKRECNRRRSRIQRHNTVWQECMRERERERERGGKREREGGRERERERGKERERGVGWGKSVMIEKRSNKRDLKRIKEWKTLRTTEKSEMRREVVGGKK